MRMRSDERIASIELIRVADIIRIPSLATDNRLRVCIAPVGRGSLRARA